MKITDIWLRNNATPTSYSRGEDYVDEVHKLTKKGNTYTAQVYGSDTYHVTIETSTFDANAFCSCPYDWGGICKHVVAVGLNIIAGQIKEIEVIDVENALSLSAHAQVVSVSPDEFYDSVFMSSDEAVRTQFLKQLFQKDSALRAQFEQFISQETEEIVFEDIDEIAEELREELNELDFDIEDISRSSRGGSSRYDYYDDYDEGYSEAAIEIIEECIKSYGKKAEIYLAKGNLTDATRVVLGMYEATFGLETPYFEEYPYFEDLDDEASTIYQDWLLNIGEIGKKIIKNEEAVQQTINLIFERWKLFYQGSGENPHTIEYDLAIFEPYLKGLVNTPWAGEYLLDVLEQHERYAYTNANLYLYLADLTQNEDLKIKILEDFASQSTPLAQQLLDYYFKNELLADFYRVARQSFNIFPNQMDKFLLEKITPEQDLAFYLEVLYYFTKERSNIDGYKELKKYWTAKEKNAFIDDNRLNASFYVQMLEVEKRFEDILKVVKTNKDTWGFDKLTLPILNIYPQEMLNIYFQRAYRAMGPGAQDRKKYRQVAKDLKPILQITQLQEKRTVLIKQLKNKYRHLPAFQDEMNKVGF